MQILFHFIPPDCQRRWYQHWMTHTNMVTRNLCIPGSVCRSNGQTKHLLGQLNRVRVKEWAKPMMKSIQLPCSTEVHLLLRSLIRLVPPEGKPWQYPRSKRSGDAPLHQCHNQNLHCFKAQPLFPSSTSGGQSSCDISTTSGSNITFTYTTHWTVPQLHAAKH